jgi:hypothetical protein
MHHPVRSALLAIGFVAFVLGGPPTARAQDGTLGWEWMGCDGSTVYRGSWHHSWHPGVAIWEIPAK